MVRCFASNCRAPCRPSGLADLEAAATNGSGPQKRCWPQAPTISQGREIPSRPAARDASITGSFGVRSVQARPVHRLLRTVLDPGRARNIAHDAATKSSVTRGRSSWRCSKCSLEKSRLWYSVARRAVRGWLAVVCVGADDEDRVAGIAHPVNPGCSDSVQYPATC